MNRAHRLDSPEVVEGAGSSTTQDDVDPVVSFTRYVTQRQQRLIGFAHALTGDRAEAEDLVQTALAKVWLRWGRVSAPGFATDAYLRRVIVNQHRSWWRRAWRTSETVSDDPPERGDARPWAAPGAHDIDLWRAVLALPPRQRAVIALRFVDDADVAETARLMHCSEGTVKSQTAKALATLRAHADTFREEP